MSLIALLSLLLAAPTRWVVGLDVEDSRARSASPAVDSVLAAGGVEVRRLSRSIVVDLASGGGREQLASLPGVRWVEQEVFFPVVLRAVPDDPHYPEAWHLHTSPLAAPETAISLEAAWDLTRGLDPSGVPVRVGVVDDGFDLGHADLLFAALGLDIAQQPPDNDPSAAPPDNHGTQTAGVIAAAGFNGIGVVGVCPACELLPVRLIGGGGPGDLYTSGSAAAEAIEWAVDNGAAVINNSWGPPDGNRYDPFDRVLSWPIPKALAEALLYAATQGRGGLGTVVTWSAGNGAELATYDGFASDPRVIAVGAIEAAGHIASYSDFGPTVRLVAPSSGDSTDPAIWTTDRSGSEGVGPSDYTDRFGGTSAAAGMVAGVAALVVAGYPDLSAAQVTEALFDGAVAIDAERGQYVEGRSSLYGYGRVDAAAALAAAALYYDDCTYWLDVCANRLDDDCDGVIDDPETCTPCFPANNEQEVCDGVDNNCDGQVDELFVCQATDRPLCAPCTTSSQCALDARCQASTDFPGTWCFAECLDGQTCAAPYACDGKVCVLETGPGLLSCFDVLRCGQPERCDRLDNDCNGVVDDVGADTLEAIVATRRCGEHGVCVGPRAVCVDGRWQCPRPETYQARETRCDRLDNDCDGETDEHPLCAPQPASCWGTRISAYRLDSKGEIDLTAHFAWQRPNDARGLAPGVRGHACPLSDASIAGLLLLGFVRRASRRA